MFFGALSPSCGPSDGLRIHYGRSLVVLDDLRKEQALPLDVKEETLVEIHLYKANPSDLCKV